MKSKFLKWGSAELFFMTSVSSSLLFGVFNADVARQMHLSESTMGWLSGIFFIVYALAQFYSGRLFVIYSSRNILFISAVIAAFGAMIFSHTSHIMLMFVARAMLGMGLATTFIGVLFIVQQNFTKQQFPLLSAISQSLSNLTAGILGFLLGSIHDYHLPFTYLSYMLFICAAFIWFLIDKSKPTISTTDSETSLLDGVLLIIKNPQVWFATIFFAGLFGGILTFPDLFNISFQVEVFHLTFQHAAIINSMILLGFTLGGLVSGFWAQKTNYLAPARVISFIAILAFGVLLFIRFQAKDAFLWVSSIGFIYGFGCSSSILAFQCVQLNIKSVNVKSLASSFVLTMSYIFSGMIEQPIVGRFIENTRVTKDESYFINHNSLVFLFSEHDKWYQYNAGLCFILLFIILSFIASLFFKNPA